MPKIDDYFDEIDLARIRRAKELSELKRLFGTASADPYGVASKAVVVLCYATWEGFYNECARAYLRFLRERGGKVSQSDWMLMVGVLSGDLQSVRDRNHSLEAVQNFVVSLKEKLECDYGSVDGKLIEARSNLDFAKIQQNYLLLNFDLLKMQKHRNKIDKELVGWRHSVAHGDSPDLSTLDVTDHIKFTSGMLVEVADQFQLSMLSKI